MEEKKKRGNPNIKQLQKEQAEKNKGIKNPAFVKPITRYDTICKTLKIEQFAKFTKIQKYNMIGGLLEMSQRQLSKLSKDNNIPIFIQIIAKSIIENLKAGKVYTVELLFDRFYGKPTQEVITTVKESKPTVDNLEKFTTEELSEYLSKSGTSN